MALDKRTFIPAKTSTEKTKDQLIIENSTDALTGIGNRLYWEENLVELRQSPNPLAVILVDINNFKGINDKNGHLVGDMTLVSVAGILAKSVREYDILARVGGDEFAIALPCQGTEEEELNSTPKEIIRRIRKNLEESNQSSEIRVGLSIGFAISSEQPHKLETAVDLADQRMYQDKEDQRTLKLVEGAGI